ncbi:hypothetical protein [Serratia quinivorans]|jgi:urease accessory protein UreF|uniref:hypothetical protein n=1 Tax=Serratia quinivorans TaxID=137545 RepID=UPI000F91CFB2|nr:hypothetical protein [Serratia quinivorans]
MDQTKHQQAYQRGVRMARLWHNLKDTVLAWDERCVTRTSKMNLPNWAGHVPLVLLVSLCSLLLAICGLFIAATIITGLAFLLALTFLVKQSRETKINPTTQQKNQNAADYMYESAVMNKEYDGTPYRSPNDN